MPDSAQRSAIQNELHGHKVCVRDATRLIEGFYPDDTALQPKIDTFVRQKQFYAQGRWKALPQSPESEHSLYKPIAGLFTAAFKKAETSRFRSVFINDRKTLKHDKPGNRSHAPGQPVYEICEAEEAYGEERGEGEAEEGEGEEEHKEKQEEEEEDEDEETYPDLVITGTNIFLGPATQDATDVVDYKSIISMIDVKTEKKMGQVRDHAAQLGIYARQIFFVQPSRLFVRCATLSQSSARVFHFDRSGLLYSDPFDIHKNPGHLVRLILGLGSLSPELAGFDKRFSHITVNGKQIGTIKIEMNTTNGEKRPFNFTMARNRPIFRREYLCGRGTVCFGVNMAVEDDCATLTTTIDPKEPMVAENQIEDDSDGDDSGWEDDEDEGEKCDYLLKRSYCTKDRTKEYELLKKAEGLKGVAQMVAYADGHSTADFRPDWARPEDFTERVERWILMPMYGGPVSNFRGRRQFLRAFRDAIGGYENLAARGVLHRDISVGNIQLGKRGALRGNKGILIGLDMGTEVDREGRSKDPRIGTRKYQSVNALRVIQAGNDAQAWGLRAAHEYRDDLESFFYVFVDVLFGYAANGKWLTHARCHRVMGDWDGNVGTALDSKRCFLLFRDDDKPERLIDQSWGPSVKTLFIEFHTLIKNMFLRRSKGLEAIGNEYQEIYRLFDTAIAGVAAEAAALVNHDNQKRRHPDEAEEIPGSLKRQCLEHSPFVATSDPSSNAT